MLEQLTALISEVTLENVKIFLLCYLLWTPIAVLTFGCFGGAVIILLQMRVLAGRAKMCLIITNTLMGLAEAASWWYFVLWSCYYNGVGVLLIMAAIIVAIIIYTAMAMYIRHLFLLYGPKW